MPACGSLRLTTVSKGCGLQVVMTGTKCDPWPACQMLCCAVLASMCVDVILVWLQGSRRASLSQQPLVERHIPPKTSADATASTTAAAAGVASGAAAAQAHNTPAEADLTADAAEFEGAHARDGSSGSTTVMCSAAASAPTATAAAAEGGANPGSSSCQAGRTFLTDPGSQPPSPAVRRPCAIAPGAATDMSAFSPGTATCAAADAGDDADPDAAAVLGEGGGWVDGTGRAASPELQEYVAYLAAATRVSSSSAAGLDDDTAAVAAGSAPLAAAAAADVDGGAAAEGGFDASSRLLWYVHGAASSAVRPTPRTGSAAATGVRTGASPTSLQAAAGGCSSQGAAAPGSSSYIQAPRPGSVSPSGRRPAAAAGPHWSPVPPQTQLKPPVVVRPM
jgi:hypothetical protein